ncbi:heat-inducible transcriptional repressor HrcA [Methylothermus subterraneus]|nr:heat-inducible transcription repressor HrcA [uncultured Gammaproteobacteria bacterium]
MELTERAQHLLKVLIERYIEEGQPVGSRTLARDAGLNLSPATVRNVVADLEEMGLVTSPHTSAGRVPTVKGYRLFIDSLLTVKPLEQALTQKLWQDFEALEDPHELLETASRLLSRITHMAGVVTLPRRQQIALRQIEFLPLSQGRVLVILVTDDQEIHNRIIRPTQPFTPSQLQQAANYLNAHLKGKRLTELRSTLLRELQQAGEQLSAEIRSVLEMAEKALETEEAEGDFVLSGQTNLMDFAELADRTRLRTLFEAFEEKRNLLHLLDQCIEAEGVQIFIGEESGYEPLEQCSLVTRSYVVDGRTLGVLGVIGPTRMHYENVIPLVDVTAKLLSAALNQKLKSPS